MSDVDFTRGVWVLASTKNGIFIGRFPEVSELTWPVKEHANGLSPLFDAVLLRTISIPMNDGRGGMSIRNETMMEPFAGILKPVQIWLASPEYVFVKDLDERDQKMLFEMYQRTLEMMDANRAQRMGLAIPKGSLLG